MEQVLTRAEHLVSCIPTIKPVPPNGNVKPAVACLTGTYMSCQSWNLLYPAQSGICPAQNEYGTSLAHRGTCRILPSVESA